MTKEFEQYIHNTRNEFVTAVNELQWKTGFRTKCENLLIAYDQMKQALRKANVSGSLPTDEQILEMAESFTKDLNVSNATKRATQFGYQEGVYKMIEIWKQSNNDR